jgi:AhpD family alkylhydroperoxidase
MTALVLTALLAPAQPAPSPDPKPVPATRSDVKAAMEGHKTARPRLPFPPGEGEGPFAKVNNGRFRAYYLPAEFGAGTAGGRTGTGPAADAAATLDNTFKTRLFWVVSRANNCYYCLGHQEYKLSAAGLTDDEIAALDGDWDALAPNLRAAVLFTRKLTHAPHTVGEADVAELRKHFTPTQCSEIVLAVAGFNATNRWTDGLNIPGEAGGDFFAKEGKKVASFKDAASPKYADFVSKVAPLPEKCVKASAPAWPARPKLEDRAAVEAAWAAAAARTPLLPLADDAKAVGYEGVAPHWARLLAVFPNSMKGRVAGLKAAATGGKLSPRLSAAIAWAAAREDRAWYAQTVARDRLRAAGLTDDQIFGLDGDAAALPPRERKALAFARKLTAAPATVTDADVEALRKEFTDFEVAEVVHHVCNAAFFDRATEAARLPLDK